MGSIVKGVTKPYPLRIKSTLTETYDVDYHEVGLEKMLSRTEFSALLSALQDIGIQHDLPGELPEFGQMPEDMKKLLHHLLFETEVMEGCLVCPESGREFPIKNGIPNMLLTEEEV